MRWCGVRLTTGLAVVATTIVSAVVVLAGVIATAWAMVISVFPGAQRAAVGKGTVVLDALDTTVPILATL